MNRFDILKFHDNRLECPDLIKDVFRAEPKQVLYAYAMGKSPHYSLLVTTDRLQPHLYFLRTVISNYQGATADAMEIFASLGVDVRSYEDITIGNVALWNVSLVFPKEADLFETREKILLQLQKKCGIVPPIDFFFVEFFHHLGNVEERMREITISEDYQLTLSEGIIKEIGIGWNAREPSAVVATPFEPVPGLLFSFIPAEKELVECELVMEDRVGSMGELSRIVSGDVDLVASSGITIVFGRTAVWKFCGILTGSLENLRSKLERRKPPFNMRKLRKIDPRRI